MKFSKRCILFLTSVIIVSLLAGCGSKYVPYNYSLDKYIQLGQYKGISYDFVGVNASEDALQQTINEDLKNNGYGQPGQITSGKIMTGDVVTVDFSGSIDGVVDNALSASALEIEIGAGLFLDEFEDGLVGQKIGEECKISVLFPDDYVKLAYAGKTAEYTVKILSAKRNQYPELTDDIVSEISEHKTVEEYKKAMQQKTAEDAVVAADEEREQTVWDIAVKNATVSEYPEKAINYLVEECRGEFKSKADEKEQTFTQFLEENSLTGEEFEQYLINRSQKICKEEMVVYAIARAESINVSNKEIKALAKKYMETYGYKSASELYKDYSKEKVKQSILYQKVKDFVLENAKQVG